MKVNFLDLKAQYLSIKEEVDEAIQNVLLDSAFTAGPYVKSFEENFARRHNAKYCVGVNSGTSALHTALVALDIKNGNDVIVPTNTFFATPEAVSLAGAIPVFVDCEPVYYNIDINQIEKSITDKTKAIIAVNLYGQPAQLDKIKAIAKENNLILIEDCAQSHISEYLPRGISDKEKNPDNKGNNIPPGSPCGINKENSTQTNIISIPQGKGKSVGTFGICGCFSFYCGKNLGAYGEGGVIITNDENLYKKMMMIRDHGMSQKYHHEIIGHNYRMAGLQGAILDVKLKYLDEWTETRRKNAELYRQYLKDCKEIVLPGEMSNAKHVYHLFVIRTQKRDGLMNFLKKNQIFAGMHYPIPCHLQKAYSFLGYKKGDFPVSEKYADEVLSLPMSEQLKEDEIKYVSEKIKEFFSMF
ncbi:DegT/DnrJ/EryC1/StrS family aminotransferase [candidate division WOR-3 bacterium]|nr:DegT/DnrJ/EryC1/StrS family aminotransferase [candidate division WOR-3 bacterium]